jgi:putative heme-binding domain-containing protein
VKGEPLFRRQSCIACHTYINGQSPKGPHLVDIGKRYKKEELIESLLQPSKKLAQGFETFSFLTTQGQTITGFVVSESAETITLRETNGLSKELKPNEIEERIKRELSMMPQGIVNNLTPEDLAHLIAYLQSLK